MALQTVFYYFLGNTNININQPSLTTNNNLPFQIRENRNAPIQSQPVAIVVINYRVYFQTALHERTPPAYA
jgi:hypothetical protein